MSITITLTANSFQELFAMMRDVPVASVAPVTHTTEPVEEEPSLHVVTDEERDSAGEVWNTDLHASSKAKNKDGTWRAKRVVNAPEAAPVVSAPTLTFADVMTVVSRKMTEGKLTMAKLGEIQVLFGLENISMVGTRPDIIDAVYNTIDAL